jgi:hypothetical protein
MKTLRLICPIVGLTVLFTSCSIFNKSKSRESLSTQNKSNSTVPGEMSASGLSPSGLRNHVNQVMQYALQNGYSTEYCFLIDMGISSGKNRFFVYDIKHDSIIQSGLVAHGNCNTRFLEQPVFSNSPNCGCSSLGKYKVGTAYRGEFGKSYRLYGLDSSNSNALKRAIVLHGFSPIPDQEIYPRALCNSFGCPMVSQSFLTRLSGIIDRSEKPILLWVYE